MTGTFIQSAADDRGNNFRNIVDPTGRKLFTSTFDRNGALYTQTEIVEPPALTTGWYRTREYRLTYFPWLYRITNNTMAANGYYYIAYTEDAGSSPDVRRTLPGETFTGGTARDYYLVANDGDGDATYMFTHYYDYVHNEELRSVHIVDNKLWVARKTTEPFSDEIACYTGFVSGVKVLSIESHATVVLVPKTIESLYGPVVGPDLYALTTESVVEHSITDPTYSWVNLWKVTPTGETHIANIPGGWSTNLGTLVDWTVYGTHPRIENNILWFKTDSQFTVSQQRIVAYDLVANTQAFYGITWSPYTQVFLDDVMRDGKAVIVYHDVTENTMQWMRVSKSGTSINILSYPHFSDEGGFNQQYFWRVNDTQYGKAEVIDGESTIVIYNSATAVGDSGTPTDVIIPDPASPGSDWNVRSVGATTLESFGAEFFPWVSDTDVDGLYPDYALNIAYGEPL